MNSLTMRYATASIVLCISAAVPFCQSDTSALCSDAVTPGGAASLNLSLSSASGSQPAGIDWTFTYSTSAIIASSIFSQLRGYGRRKVPFVRGKPRLLHVLPDPARPRLLEHKHHPEGRGSGPHGHDIGYDDRDQHQHRQRAG